MRVKTKVITVRVSEKQRKEWQAEAESAGLTISQWVTLRCNGVVLVRTGSKVAA